MKKSEIGWYSQGEYGQCVRLPHGCPHNPHGDDEREYVNDGIHVRDRL